MRSNASLRMFALGAAFVLFSINGVLCLGGSGQEITLTFADGLAPSAKGWTFQGHDQFQQPLTESQVASVSGGVLHLDTVPFGGVGSNDTLAFWQIPIANIDPSNYEYEIRMRAIAPNSFRNCLGGLLGAGIEVRANFDTDVTVMQPQVHVGGFAPVSSSDPCFVFSTDASVFHTYKLVVQNNDQGTFYIDGVQIAQGVLTRANTLSLEAVFGDLSTSGGNVTAEIEFIRIASLTRICVSPPANLVAWWPGDGDANDIIGAGEGSLQNGATFAPAMVGQAFHLDGVDDFVQVPDSPNQSPSSITIEMWVLAEAIDGLRPIITKYNPLPIGSSWFVEVSEGQIRWGVFPNPTSSWRSVHTASAVISTFAWHHVAVTFDSSSEAMQVYVDGVEVPSVLDSAVPVTAIADSEGPLRIGAEVNADGALGGVWKGLIDEVAIFDRALPTSEIQGIFNAGSAGKCKNAQLTDLGAANVWLGLKNSDDVGTKFDLLAEVFKNGSPVGSGQLNSVPGGSSGFNNAVSRTIDLALSAPTDIHNGDTLSIKLSVRIAVNVSGHRSGTARLWFNDAAATSRFDATIGAVTNAYFLLDGLTLGSAAGLGPKKTIDVFVDRAAGGNPFKPFGTWSKTF